MVNKTITIRTTSSVFKTVVELPLSKSETNRMLIIRALSNKAVSLDTISSAHDSVLLDKLLAAFEKGERVLDAEDAGTTFRFLTAYLALKNKPCVLAGTDRMKERPVAILVQALRSLGAKIEYLEKEGFPPLKFNGGALSGGELLMDASTSSQYISALMLIAPKLKGGLTIHLKNKISSRPYLEMTAKQMQMCGVAVVIESDKIIIPEKKYSSKGVFEIEADWSAASYWYSFVALAQEAEIELEGLNKESLQGDAVVAKLFEPLGVKTTYTSNGVTLSKINTTIEKFEYDFSDCPDLAQTLAVVLAVKNIPSVLSGLDSLRIKETDRIGALKNELEKIGADVRIHGDTININPNPQAPNAKRQTLNVKLETLSTQHQTSNLELRTYKDHRMAMAFAPLCMLFDQVSFDDATVVKKSYPHFWDDLKKVGINEV